MVVEDEVNLREYLVTNLSFAYHVVSASNGQEAIELLVNKKVDLVVSDVRMPYMSGTELCKQIRSNDALMDMKIILLTAKVLNENRKEGYESGADAYIEKPFQLDVLTTRIDNLIGRQLQYKNNLIGSKGLKDDLTGIEEDSFYDKIIAVLEKNITNQNFKSALVLKELGVGKTVFYKKIKENSITNLNELMQSMRLKKATQLLIQTSKSPSDIATMVGFANAKYFSTCFKKKYDMTPTGYRKEKKKLEKRVVQGLK
jgi:YesN/AraC family two-component response regulator